MNKNKISEPFVEVPREDFGSTCRKPTKKEMEAAKKLKTSYNEINARIKHLRAEADRLEARLPKCEHIVRVDQPGWLYDFRSCYSCNAGLGAI
jgi:hypothetical protein